MPDPRVSLPMAFQSDHRATNPGLHALYVRYAYEELRMADAFVADMFELSRVSASIIASKTWEQCQEEILRDAAWFEAAALLKAGVELPEKQPHESRWGTADVKLDVSGHVRATVHDYDTSTSAGRIAALGRQIGDFFKRWTI